MEKIELHEIVGYLPYCLVCQYVVRDTVIRTDVLTSITFNPSETHPERLSVSYNEKEHIWMFKPILRPLSDLIKSISNDSNNVSYAAYLGLYGQVNIDYTIGEPLNLGYKDIQFLLSHHFDIHNLINRGLAIDINTI